MLIVWSSETNIGEVTRVYFTVKYTNKHIHKKEKKQNVKYCFQ